MSGVWKLLDEGRRASSNTRPKPMSKLDDGLRRRRRYYFHFQDRRDFAKCQPPRQGGNGGIDVRRPEKRGLLSYQRLSDRIVEPAQRQLDSRGMLFPRYVGVWPDHERKCATEGAATFSHFGGSIPRTAVMTLSYGTMATQQGGLNLRWIGSAEQL
jgi:hypothetical protein